MIKYRSLLMISKSKDNYDILFLYFYFFLHTLITFLFVNKTKLQPIFTVKLKIFQYFL